MDKIYAAFDRSAFDLDGHMLLTEAQEICRRRKVKARIFTPMPECLWIGNLDPLGTYSTKKKNKPGRPRTRPNQRIFSLLLSEDERRIFGDAADQAGVSVSTWLRRLANAAVGSKETNETEIDSDDGEE